MICERCKNFLKIGENTKRGVLKKALVTTNGDYRFNIDITTNEKITRLILNLNKL